jgi:hypothetical protein
VVKLPLDLEGTEPPSETVIGPEVNGGEGEGAVVAADVVAELDGGGASDSYMAHNLEDLEWAGV